MVRARLRLLLVLTLAPFLLIIGRLVQLQILFPHVEDESDIFERATFTTLHAPRGEIRDRDGNLLAGNETRFDLYFTLEDFLPRELYFAELQRALEFCQEEPRPGPLGMCSCEVLEKSLIERRASTATDLRLYRDHHVIEGKPELALAQFDRPFPVGHWRRMKYGLRKALKDRGHVFEPVPGTKTGRLTVNFADLLAPELSLLRLEQMGCGEYETMRERVTEAVRELHELLHSDSPPNRWERSVYRREPRLLVRDVHREALTEVLYHPDRFGGLTVRSRSRRVYPHGEITGAITGYLGNYLAGASPEEVEELRAGGRLLDFPTRDKRAFFDAFEERRVEGYFSDALVGRRGLERAYEERLRSRPGLRADHRDALGAWIPLLERPLEALPGESIHTTLDLGLQRRLHQRLESLVRGGERGKGGSIVVLDLGDAERGSPPGGVLAMAGYPGFDAERFSHETAYIETALSGEDPSVSLFHRPVDGHLNPGSLFKLVVAMAALEDAVLVGGGTAPGEAWPRRPLSPSRRYECRYVFDDQRFPGKFKCNSQHQHHHSRPDLDLVDAIRYSCNTYFYELGRSRLDPELLWRWGRKLGYGRPVYLDLDRPRREQLELWPPDSTRSRRGKLDRSLGRRYPRILHYTIGQVYVEASPLQVARSIATIALDGVAPFPYLVDSLAPERVVARPGSFRLLRRGMEAAVAETRGTAHKLTLPEYSVAMKTGTAQTARTGPGGQKLYHAWAGGFAPVKNPRVAFVVRFELSELGGGDATAPLVETLLELLEEREPGVYRRDSEAVGSVERAAPGRAVARGGER